MSSIPPVEPTEPIDPPASVEPRRDERPRPRYGEYAPEGAAPFVPPTPREDYPAPTSTTPQYTEAAQVFHNAPPAHSKRLGVVAFVVSIVLLAFGLALSIVAGFAFGPLASKMITSSGTIDQTAISSDDPGVAGFGMLAVAFFAGGTLLGLWALVQGIIATVKKRGRAFGIVAMCLAVATPVICFVVFYVVTFASAPEIISSVS